MFQIPTQCSTNMDWVGLEHGIHLNSFANPSSCHNISTEKSQQQERLREDSLDEKHRFISPLTFIRSGARKYVSSQTRTEQLRSTICMKIETITIVIIKIRCDFIQSDQTCCYKGFLIEQNPCVHQGHVSPIKT